MVKGLLQRLRSRGETLQVRSAQPLLHRTQGLFFLFAAFNCLGAIPDYFHHSAHDPYAFYGVLLIPALVAWWAYFGLYRKRFPWFADVLESGALAVICLGFGDPFRAVGVLNAANLFRPMFGNHWQAVLRLALYFGVFFLVMFHPQNPNPPQPQQIAGMLMALLLVCLLTRALNAGLSSHDRGLIRERRMHEIGEALITVRKEEDIHRVLIYPLWQLLRDENIDGALITLAKQGPDHLRVLAFSHNIQATWQDQLLPLQTVDYNVRHLQAPAFIPELLPVVRRHLNEPDQNIGDMVMLVPYCAHGEMHGGFLITGKRKPLERVADALATVSSSVGLALDAIRSRERLASLVRNSSDVITILDGEGRVTYQSESTLRLFGHRANALVGRPLIDVVDPAHRRAFEYLMTAVLDNPDVPKSAEWLWQRMDGQTLYTESIATNLLDDPSVHGIVLNTRDVSERKALEEKLRHQASHDPLTNLANRALFRDRVDAALARKERHGGQVAVVYIDLDDFKGVNDNLGHQAGDEILLVVAAVLAASIRAVDTAARLGGDEFAVLLEDFHQPADAEQVCERILSASHQPVTLDDHVLRLRLSLGLAMAEEGDDTDALLHKADTAMYAAKVGGKDRYLSYHPALSNKSA